MPSSSRTENPADRRLPDLSNMEGIQRLLRRLIKMSFREEMDSSVAKRIAEICEKLINTMKHADLEADISELQQIIKANGLTVNGRLQ